MGEMSKFYPLKKIFHVNRHSIYFKFFLRQGDSLQYMIYIKKKYSHKLKV
jgi:hypothetical protein